MDDEGPARGGGLALAVGFAAAVERRSALLGSDRRAFCRFLDGARAEDGLDTGEAPSARRERFARVRRGRESDDIEEADRDEDEDEDDIMNRTVGIANQSGRKG